jgi:hypothetical protein
MIQFISLLEFKSSWMICPVMRCDIKISSGYREQSTRNAAKTYVFENLAAVQPYWQLNLASRTFISLWDAHVSRLTMIIVRARVPENPG